MVIEGVAEGARARLKAEAATGLAGLRLTEGLAGQWIQPYWLWLTADQAGGTLTVEAEEGRVSMTVRMPCLIPNPNASLTARKRYWRLKRRVIPARWENIALDVRTCLIVDDSRIIRKVARRIVEGLGFEVDEAADGVEALSYCAG